MVVVAPGAAVRSRAEPEPVTRSVPPLWRLRCQPPVLSPLSAGGLRRAWVAALRADSADLAALKRLLLREYHADGAVLTGSGTQALQLAIEAALACAEGARIIALPAFACFDLVTAAVGVRGGLRVTFYDLDPDTLAPDLRSLEAAFRRGARVAVLAPLYGIPLPWDALEQCAAPHGALLIEDAAQGHGASWHGRPLGSLGRISVLSFGRGKGWTAGGGGALLWRGAELASTGEQLERELLPALPNAGVGACARATTQWLLARPSLYGIPAGLPWIGLGETRYREPTLPRSMPAASAALALSTLGQARAEAETRRSRGAWLRARIDTPATNIQVTPGGDAGFLRLPVRLADASAESAVRQLRDVGAAASYPSTLGELPAVRPLLLSAQALVWPGAAALVRQLITLPTHSLLDTSDLQRLAAALEAT